MIFKGANAALVLGQKNSRYVHCKYCGNSICLIRSKRTGRYYAANSERPGDFHQCSQKRAQRTRKNLEKMGKKRTDLLRKPLHPITWYNPIEQ